VLAQQGCPETQHLVWKVVPGGPQLGHHALNLDHVPGHYDVMQHRQGAEALELISELPAPQCAFLSGEQEPGQGIRRLSSVRLPCLRAASSSPWSAPRKLDGMK